MPLYKDIETKLKKIFNLVEESVVIDQAKKTRLKCYALEEFALERCRSEKGKWFFFRVFRKRPQMVAFSLLSILVLFNLLPNDGQELYAGKIYPKHGMVEIVRDGKIILVKEVTDIRVNDFVRIGNKSEADILLPSKFLSTAQNKTLVHVTDDKNLFLEEGVLSNQSFDGEELLTANGKVAGENGSGFDVFVSSTGETRVITKQNKVFVFDKNDRRLELYQGEEVKLRPDTVLNDQVVPEDLKLSTSQITAIKAKLVIARTKVGRGLEKSMKLKNTEAKADFVSAEKTFRSIVQVSNSTRNLEILKRINTDLVRNADVLTVLSRRTNDQVLLDEVRATEEIFNILNVNNGRFAFDLKDSGVSSFDNFVIFDRLFSLGSADKKAFADIVKKKYVVEFLRQIQEEIVFVEQVSFMKENLVKLPRSNRLAAEFVQILEAIADPELGEVISYR